MRDAQRVTIVFAGGKKHYDTDLGKMVGGEPVERVFPCFISDTGIKLSSLLSDKKNVDSKTVRINQSVSGTIDHVIISGKKYNVLNSKGFYNRREAIFVEETTNGG